MDDQEYEHIPWDPSDRDGRREPWEEPVRTRSWTNWAMLICVLLLLAVLVAAAVMLRFGVLSGENARNAAESMPVVEIPELPRGGSGVQVEMTLNDRTDREALSYSEVYQKNIPSVVTVRASLSGVYSVGTGIILTADGYILTNSHVVDDAYAVTVVLNTGEEEEAVLVGRDKETDLAVLKIEADHLTPAEFGDADDLVVGEEVLAIGNPLGEQLKGTLTNGIVSAINRDVSVEGYMMTLIQTTAALNSGNSGGPLINLQGQVIGINTVKMMSDYDTIEGLGFAIPVNTAKPIVEELIAQGYLTERLTIGIYGMASAQPAGVLVSSTVSGAGAEAAGIQAGDVITAVNGTAVTSVEDVNAIKEGFAPGDYLDVTVDRDGTEYTMSVEIRDSNDIDE